MQTGCGPLYVTINEEGGGALRVIYDHGQSGRLRRVRKARRSAGWSRWPGGAGSAEPGHQAALRIFPAIRPSGFGENKFVSCADAVAKAIRHPHGVRGLAMRRR